MIGWPKKDLGEKISVPPWEMLRAAAYIEMMVASNDSLQHEQELCVEIWKQPVRVFHLLDAVGENGYARGDDDDNVLEHLKNFAPGTPKLVYVEAKKKRPSDLSQRTPKPKRCRLRKKAPAGGSLVRNMSSSKTTPAASTKWICAM